MDNAKDENAVPGREITVMAAPDATDATEASFASRVRVVENADAAASRNSLSFERAHAILLTAMLVMLAGFVAVSIMFGLTVSREIRAVSARVDVAAQLRVADQAALDSRLDQLLQNTTRSARTTQAQMAPVYALPPLRPHS